MALNVVSDNDLIKKELAFAMLPSRNPTPNPPDIDSGIANSGSFGMYFAPGASVTNYDAPRPQLGFVWPMALLCTPLQVVNLHWSQPCHQPAGMAMSWQASPIP